MDFNQEQLKDYLLGKLTEDESDQMLIRCLENDLLYDLLLVVEDTLISNLISGQMPEAERQAFERSIACSPYLREKIAFARTLLAFEPTLAAMVAAQTPSDAQVSALVKRERDLSSEIQEIKSLESRFDKVISAVADKLKLWLTGGAADSAVTLYEFWQVRARRWQQVQRVAFGLFCLSVVLYACIIYSLMSTQQYVIASGGNFGSYPKIANALRDTLNQSLSGDQSPLSRISFKAMKFKVVGSDGGQDNVNKVSLGEAQLAIAQKGLSPKDQTKPHPRALLYLSNSRLFVVARKGEGLKNISALNDIPDGTLYLGPEDSATRVVAKLIVSHYKLKTSLATTQQLNFEQARGKLKTGELKAGFFILGPEETQGIPTIISQFAEDELFELLDVERADGIQGAYPYLEKTTISKASFPAKDDFPDRDIVSLQVEDVLICNDTLSDSDAWTIIKTVEDSLTKLADKIPNLTAKSPLQDPNAKKHYPPHPGASLYFTGGSAGNPLLRQLSFLCPLALLMLFLFTIYRARLKYAHALSESLYQKTNQAN